MTNNLKKNQKTIYSFSQSFYIIVLIFFSIGLYFPTLQYGFVYDDDYQILDNKWIRDIKYLPDIFTSSGWSFNADDTKSSIYRPMQHVIYMLEYHVFGFKSWGYHLVNTILHAVNTVLVFFLAEFIFHSSPGIVKKKIKEPEDTANPQPHYKIYNLNINPAFIVALLFAAHPINTESVAWIGTLPELFMTAMYLLSFFLYATCLPGLNSRFIFSVIFFLISILFKETAITLLPLLFLYDYFKNNSFLPIKRCKRYIPYLLVMFIYIFLRVIALEGVTASEKTGITIAQLIINTFPLFLQYILLLFFPFDLKAIYIFYPFHSFTELPVIMSIAFVIIFFLYLTRTKDNIFSLGLIFTIIPLIPVFYLPAIRDDVFAERYLYLSSFGFVLLVVHILGKIYFYLNEKRLNYSINSRGIILLFLMILMVYTILTGKRQLIWKNNLSLWTDTVKKSPDSFKAQNNLGIALGRHGNVKASIDHFYNALRIKPDFIDAHNNIGVALYSMGKAEEAISHFSYVLRFKPNFPKTHYNLGYILSEQGKYTDAIKHLNESLKIKPDYANAHFSLGVTFERIGNINEAKNHYHKAMLLGKKAN